jgi:hypothetical protein
MSSRRAIYKARPREAPKIPSLYNLHCTCGGDAFQLSLVYDRRLRSTHSQTGQKSKLKHSQFRQAAASFRICWSACPCLYGCTHVQVFKLITCSVDISVFVPVSPHQLEIEPPTYSTPRRPRQGFVKPVTTGVSYWAVPCFWLGVQCSYSISIGVNLWL